MQELVRGAKIDTIAQDPAPKKRKRAHRFVQPGMSTCSACRKVYPRKMLFVGVEKKRIICGICLKSKAEKIAAGGGSAPGSKRLGIMVKKCRAYDRKMKR